MSQSSELIQSAQRTLRLELEAVEGLLARIDDSFVNACELILASKGRVVVVGMGKSGHIGNKIAATLASTGTPAFFVHPAEASHGDMGMITRDDVILAL
ncbi:MAG: SIS domain-containing protein, partial [Pseudomonas putida]